MADPKNQKNTQGPAALVDPIYQKFTRGILRAISSTEFYEYFMDAVSRAENEIQFSNRKLEKAVDLNWVDKIEQTLPAIQNILNNPRNMIKEEELVVNAANAKRSGSDVVRHLSQHASFVEDYNYESGDVRPSRLMQKYREDTEDLYENRLVFTTIEMAYHFTRIRHDALFEAMSDEIGAKLRVNSNMESATELVHMEMFLHIKNTESLIDADERNAEVFARISRMYRLLAAFMNSSFAKQMAKCTRIKGAIYKTNVLKRNPDYRKVAQLLEYLRNYTDIGYSIRVIEQSPAISETFQRDIYHNILFNYLVLKGYLQDDSDRVIPTKPRQKQRTLRPKFIREIIEELTEDYDLPDVEIRKVLIEELTKEQLLQQEAEERRRLVEEQARKKKEEQERIRKEKEAEKERIRKEKEAEKERIRQEQEAEKQRLFHERMLREAEDRRRSAIFRKELDRFSSGLREQLAAREKAVEKQLRDKEDFADAARLLEEAEQRKQDAQERERKRRQEEKERLLHQQQLEAQRREQERLRREAEALQGQIALDLEHLQPYQAELQRFLSALEQQKEARATYQQNLQKEKALFQKQRQEKLAARKALR